MRIAICDDEPVFVHRIKELILQSDLCRPTWKVSTFFSGDQLLFEYEKNRHPFDVVILDIRMEGTDGLSAGTAIRDKDTAAIILFLTAYSQFSLAAYDAFPLYFMVKPVRSAQFLQILAKACSLAAKRAEESLYIRGREMERFLPISDISYMESFSHSTLIHTVKSEQLQCPGTLKSTLEKIDKPHIFRIHKSFAVNLHETKSLHHSHRQLAMKSGVKLPVSRHRLQELSLRFIEVHTDVEPL